MPSTLRRADRIRRTSEYRAAQRSGARVHTPHFTFVLVPRSGRTPRLGITVSKKVSAKSVQRNRVKRLVREVFRRHRDLVPEGVDLVFVAKASAVGLGYEDVLAETSGAKAALDRAARRVLR
ncbi:MAG: ribonuclease P protein component [Polyangiales bacterium]|nr:ribonuclease P protein component [Myxococcales bacterium]